MSQLVKVRFTLLLAAILMAAAIYTNSHVGLLDEGIHDQVGHSPRQLIEGELRYLFSSLFFTAGGLRFYLSLLMLAIAVGWVEYRFGTWRAIATFFGVHLVTMLVMGLGIALPLTWLGSSLGKALMHVKDVGPSAGYYGCLGFATASLTWKSRNRILVAIISVLVFRLIWSSMNIEQGRDMSADLAHVIAFPMGILLQKLFYVQPIQRITEGS